MIRKGQRAGRTNGSASPLYGYFSVLLGDGISSFSPRCFVMVLGIVAQQGQQILANCTVVTDEFEGESTIYGSVQEISSSVNFVPYLDDSIANSKIRVIAGFEKNDWLFMETVKIKVGEDDYIKDYFDYFDVTRETLGGSTILEEVEYSLSYEEVEQLLAAADPVIRFEGENDATYDHQMTTEEITSLQTMYDLSTCTEEIWNILNQWTQDNMY